MNDGPISTDPRLKIIRSDEKQGTSLAIAFSLIAHGGIAVLFITLLWNQYFGEYHKLACLFVIIYSRLLAVGFFAHLETMRNCGKMDVMLEGQTTESRKFAEEIFGDAEQVFRVAITIFYILNTALLGVSIWKLF